MPAQATDEAPQGAAGRGALEQRPYGATGLTVTRLGFGAMQVGSPELPEAVAERLLHGVLDLGIRLIDTARSYGLAEQRIGRYLARRRDEFVLSTKLGYGVDGVPDWSYESVRRGVDAARARLASDVLDIVHLHSCDLATLQQGGVLDALAAAAAAGKLRVVAYSGDNEPLAAAVADGRVGGVQVSLNLCDQGARALVAAARARGLGVLVKRPLAGLPWLSGGPPTDPAHGEYWRRFQLLRPALAAGDPTALALRFAAFVPGVDACLVGGTQLAHVAANLGALAAGPLAAEERAALEAAWRRHGAAWRGVI
jgi:aryl-alcohol dehydrogenase-like predicted oxidoreductase